MFCEFYITPEEYEIAARSGIAAKTLEARVRDGAWSKKLAISVPPRKQNDRKKWAELAKQNGIKYGTFISRVNEHGMTNEEAATKPLQNKKEAIKRVSQMNKKYPQKYLDLIQVNGIKYQTFDSRIRSGWSLERAATTPTMTRKEALDLAREKSPFREMEQVRMNITKERE